MNKSMFENIIQNLMEISAVYYGDSPVIMNLWLTNILTPIGPALV